MPEGWVAQRLGLWSRLSSQLEREAAAGSRRPVEAAFLQVESALQSIAGPGNALPEATTLARVTRGLTPLLDEIDPSNHIRRRSARPLLPHRVISAWMKWVAPQETPCSEVNTAQGTVLLDCLHCIFRTGGSKSARRREERRDNHLVGTYKKNQNSLQFSPALCRNVMNSPSKSA